MVTPAFVQINLVARKKNPQDTPVRRWLQSIRAKYGLQQKDLASVVHKSRSMVSGYENGKPMPEEVVQTLLREYPDARPPKDLNIFSGSSEPKPTDVLSQRFDVEGVTYAELPYAGNVPSLKWSDPLKAEEKVKLDGKFAGKNRFAATVIGTSCHPYLQQGDTAVWETDSAPAHGVIVLCERDKAEGVSIRCKPVTGDEQDLMSLGAPSDDFSMPAGWREVARLVGVIRQHDGPERTWYWAPGLRPHHLEK